MFFLGNADGPEERAGINLRRKCGRRTFTEQQASVEMVLKAAGGVVVNIGIFFLIENLNVFIWPGIRRKQPSDQWSHPVLSAPVRSILAKR